MPENTIYIELLMLLVGVYAHFLKTVIQSKKDGAPIALRHYWVNNAYQTQLTVITAFLVFMGMLQTGQLDPVSAFFAGIACNSFSDVLGSRIKNKIQ